MVYIFLGNFVYQSVNFGDISMTVHIRHASFFSKAPEHPMMWMYHILYNHPSFDQQLGHLQYLAIINKSVINILLELCALVFLGFIFLDVKFPTQMHSFKVY